MTTGISVTVQSGETLSGLAQKYGVTVADIQAANKMGKSTSIKADSKIIIPADGKPQDEEYLAKLNNALGDKKDNYIIKKDFDSEDVKIAPKNFGMFFCDIKNDFNLRAGDLINFNPQLKTDPKIPNNDPDKSIGESILQWFDKQICSFTGYKGKYDSYLLPPEYTVTIPADRIRLGK